RRDFLADVGKGMVVASIGSGLAADLGLASAFAGEASKPLTFGDLEPLVAQMQETPADKMLPILVQKLKGSGGCPTSRRGGLRDFWAAPALANARPFGGEDYMGFHTMMALSPALHMSDEMPAAAQALPVLKVIYRNSNQMQARGGRKNEVLHHDVEPGTLP